MELTRNQREALKLGWRPADLAEEKARTVTSYKGSEDEVIGQATHRGSPSYLDPSR